MKNLQLELPDCMFSAKKMMGNTINDEDTNFLISPFYRRYFGKRYASGFFVEGFGTFGSNRWKNN